MIGDGRDCGSRETSGTGAHETVPGEAETLPLSAVIMAPPSRAIGRGHNSFALGGGGSSCPAKQA